MKDTGGCRSIYTNWGRRAGQENNCKSAYRCRASWAGALFRFGHSEQHTRVASHPANYKGSGFSSGGGVELSPQLVGAVFANQTYSHGCCRCLRFWLRPRGPCRGRRAEAIAPARIPARFGNSGFCRSGSYFCPVSAARNRGRDRNRCSSSGTNGIACRFGGVGLWDSVRTCDRRHARVAGGPWRIGSGNHHSAD